jgi:hypothetical protein
VTVRDSGTAKEQVEQAGAAGLSGTGILPVVFSDTGWKPVPLRGRSSLNS